MRRTAPAACLVLILATFTHAIAQGVVPRATSVATAQELYQRGLVAEHAQGDLPRAIALYAEAARTAGQDRALAARALMRLAASQKKVGVDAEAVRTYAEVVRVYPEQRAEAAIAQEQLAVLGRAASEKSALTRVTAATDASAVARSFVESYCAACHNAQNRIRAGGLDLDAVSRRSVRENAALWETVIRRLRVRRDPPAGHARPDEAAYRSVVATLEQALDAGYAAERRQLAAERVNDAELAARLATFLWNSLPDAPLLEAAARGNLHEPATLNGEVVRMLRDPKAISLIDGFLGPWLWLDKLKSIRADSPLAPRVDAELLEAMQTESRLFLQSQLREDRDAVELWTANYTFANERLARHYGLAGVSGPEFRRVTWPDANRAGVLGQAGPLTALAMGSRTSPTVRGIYVLTRFLGMDAPPPPANVPPLADDPPGPGAMRDRMGAHKTNPSCAVCHSLFDPLGLALEQLDATGSWRSTDGGAPIDVSGTFVDGTHFNGPAGLRAALLTYREAYYTVLTQQLLAYGITRKGKSGRVYDYEMPSVRAIVRDASSRGYRWSAILAGVAASAPFQTRHIVP